VTRYLGVDCGSKRVGLAVSDAAGILASPLEVVARAEAPARVATLVEELGIGGLVVGLPTGLSGGEGRSAAEARVLGAELAAATGLPVQFVDERFTSRLAEEALIETGMRRRRRRATVDKAAAALILQGFLDELAKQGTPGQAETLTQDS